MHIQLTADRIIGIETEGVLQQSAGERTARPFVAVERCVHGSYRRLKIDIVVEMGLLRTEEHHRIERFHMYGKPRQHRLLVVYCPTQLVRLTVRYPRGETLAVYIEYIAAELLVGMVNRICGPCQTGGQILPLDIELCGVVLMVKHLVVVIEVLTAAVFLAREIETVTKPVEEAVRFHRQQTICLHFVIPCRIIGIIVNQSLLVLTGDKPLTVFGIEMLTIGVAIFVTEGISCIDVPCSAQVTTSGYMFEKLRTLLRRTMGDIHDSSCTRRRFAVAHLSHVVLRTDIITR